MLSTEQPSLYGIAMTLHDCKDTFPNTSKMAATALMICVFSRVQQTWTELTEFFLQKTKRKKSKLPYKELDMKIRYEREAERKGKAAANTRPSTNSEGRANSLAEEMNKPARGSGSLHKHTRSTFTDLIYFF
ncbi:hypothetical protein T4D_337 [Trichinella pseudospiralis]|uniref:Uncharacterized protein n=1 Tax=Trichinella pseudospiralis TaxID=6337 RepID=A0A0V1G3V3_TRIPS|nr:hypothetical protein T4D_337 [Trichinella pseudospiralis]